MRERLTTCGEIAGAVAVTVGCGLIAIPFGVIVGGLFAIAGSVLVADR